ncbi:MAG: protein kinase domain-containing protein [Pseudomonadota bacterium]
MSSAEIVPAIRLGQRSLRGLRSENQDACGARVPFGTALARKGIACAVADGVSAAESGRIAAETSVQNFLGDYYATPDEWGVRRAGGQVLDALNRWLLGQGLQVRDTRRGHVTTFTGCVFLGRQLHVFHVGDSRLYRLRAGRLDRITRDHRVLLDDGKPVLSRALGLDHSIDIDYSALPLEAGDTWLLTTDGVHDFLADDRLRSLLQADADPEAVCTAVIDAAAAAGSDDNLSCVIVRIDTLPDAAVDELVDTWDALRIPPLLSPGQKLDGLRVEKVLAESPRSQAYRVRDEQSGALYVMKTPSPRCEDIELVRREYATETWVLRRVRHPRLPRVAEPPQPRSALYVLTEPVDGRSLRGWMKQFPQAPVTDAIQLVRQLATGLRALHRRDVVHRDVRPENILVDGNGQATLIDLGQCRVAGLADRQLDGCVGALEYAAPENTLNPRAVGERADQFSLAAMLYEMLAGRLPWSGRLADAHLQQRFERLAWVPASQYNPLVPTWLDNVLRRALDPEPAMRYGDIAEFSDALLRPAGDTAVHKPLLVRNPLRVWQGIALLLLLSQTVTLALLFMR